MPRRKTSRRPFSAPTASTTSRTSPSRSTRRRAALAGRLEVIEDRWERLVLGMPWVASCTVTGGRRGGRGLLRSEGAEYLTNAVFGEAGMREFFSHVRFHKHEDERIVVHLLVELYAQSGEEATRVLEEAARGDSRSPRSPRSRGRRRRARGSRRTRERLCSAGF